jgi:hypothetical protein
MPYVPGGYLDQQTYLDSVTQNPDGMKAFLKDWVNLGSRGIQGGDGQPASYWDVYMDMANRGIDMTGLAAPDDLPQGTAKGGGADIALTQPAAVGAVGQPQAPQQSQELTNLLSRLGVNYQNAPAPTPALLAFLNQMDSSFGQAEQNRNTSIGLINQRAADATAQQQTAGERVKQNTTTDLIRRGVLQSGEANTRYAQNAQDQGYRLSNIARTQAEGASAADTAYRAALDAGRQQALGKVMDTEQTQAATKGQSDVQSEAYRQQQAAADLAWQRQQTANKALQDIMEQQAKVA